MIGILDWGIGGLAFFTSLRRRGISSPVIYFSDSGATPYGRLSAGDLRVRVLDVATYLRAHGVRKLVVACNAASTVLPSLGVSGLHGTLPTSAGDLEVTGVIGHAVRVARAARVRQLGVIGGSRTIRSGIYRRALTTAGRTVIQRVAQPLSAYVERGELESGRLERELEAILAPLRGVDALLLACTHYTALSSHFRRHLPRARLLDPTEEMVSWVATHWTVSEGGRDRFLTSGDAVAMRASARRAFGVNLRGVSQVCLPVPAWSVKPGSAVRE